MNIKFDIDVTPQELRTFFGLPDLEPLQQEMLAHIRDQMLKGAAGFDPMSLMKPFLPGNLQSLDGMQKAFWDAMKAATQTATDKD
jgi:hypothetical protein